MITTQREILRDLEKYKIEVVMVGNEAYIAKLIVQFSPIEKIKRAQSNDLQLKKIMETLVHLFDDIFWQLRFGRVKNIY